MEYSIISWSKETYKEFQQELLKLQSKKYQAFHQKLVPNVDSIIGIPVPVLRKVAKDLKKSDVRQFLQVMEHKYYEENMLHGFVVAELCKNSKISLEERLQYIREFLPFIDNWAVCDSFCCSIKIVKKYPQEFLRLIEEVILQEKEYYRRFAFVLLMNYYINKQNMPMIFLYCIKYNMDQYYVQMAVAWLLSMCYVKEKEETLAYLYKNELDAFTYRKTISKILESNQVSKEEKQWVRENLRK